MEVKEKEGRKGSHYQEVQKGKQVKGTKKPERDKNF